MKNFIVLLFFVPLFAGAQKTHTVQAKETLYSLARKYNVHPRELASYNNIAVETSLTLGQVIKIPSKTTMAPLTNAPVVKAEEPAKKEEIKTALPVKKAEVVKATVPAKKEGAPVYHKVAKKETLYHISKLYDNVTVDDIKKWNKLTGDAVSEGTNLIVGYGGKNNGKTTEAVKEVKVAEPKAIVKEIPKVTEPEKKEADKIVKAEPVKNEETDNVTGKNFNGGVFKSLYTKQVSVKSNPAEIKGPAGIFKSTSGWEDGKYYCLTNAAPPGTIVKITNPATQRSVYAKVLDLIPDLKQNTGMVIRLSNAAASELGANTDNFESTLNF